MTPPAEFLRALRRREPLRAGGGTNALRLLDGAGDGREFDGLFIDDFAGRLLVQTSRPGQSPPAWLHALENPPASIYWKQLDARDQRPPSHWAGEPVDGPFNARENDLAYRIDFAAGYSQGIFLDQRDNRLAVRRRMRSGMTLLNCFAYTCAFSVAAAAGGAGTVSVDLSRHSLDWGKENFRLNGIDPEQEHEFLSGDVFDWLARFAKRGRRFDGIVLDPPTFSRNRDGKVFRVEHDFGALVRLAAGLLTPDGWMFCSTNARGLSAEAFRRLALSGFSQNGEGWRAEPAPMPADFTGEAYLRALWIQRH